MDYEKKYKEALERARDMLSYKEVRQEDMEYLFPELKESEDEKIRKQLVEFLDELSKLGKNTDFDRYSKADCANWLVWLEKQKTTRWSEKDNIGHDDALWCIDLASKNVTNENQMGMCWNAKRWVESRFVLGWKPRQFELFIIEALASGKAYAVDYEAELKHLYNQLLKLAEL